MGDYGTVIRTCVPARSPAKAASAIGGTRAFGQPVRYLAFLRDKMILFERLA